MPADTKHISTPTVAFWVCVAIAVAALAWLIVGSIGNYQNDHQKTWTYVVDENGVVVFETASLGYPEYVKGSDGWSEKIMVANEDGSYSAMQTDYAAMTFPFQVQVVQDPVNQVMKFARMGTVDSVPPTASPSPAP